MYCHQLSRILPKAAALPGGARRSAVVITGLLASTDPFFPFRFVCLIGFTCSLLRFWGWDYLSSVSMPVFCAGLLLFMSRGVIDYCWVFPLSGRVPVCTWVYIFTPVFGVTHCTFSCLYIKSFFPESSALCAWLHTHHSSSVTPGLLNCLLTVHCTAWL
jgi:hypothetical protein